MWIFGGKVKIKGGNNNYICNNKQRSLGPEMSLFEVGTFPPHDSNTPHGLVSRKNKTKNNMFVVFLSRAFLEIFLEN